MGKIVVGVAIVDALLGFISFGVEVPAMVLYAPLRLGCTPPLVLSALVAFFILFFLVVETHLFGVRDG